MDWQLPDIGKTITNNIFPATLARTQYISRDTVILSIGNFILLIGGSRLFPYRVIPIDTHWYVYSRCFRNHQTYIGIY